MNAKRCGSYFVLVLIACLPCFASQSANSPQQQASDIRSQLRSVDYRHYRDLEDYLSRCARVRDLLPSLESFYKWSDADLERLREKHRDNPELVKLGDFIASLNSVDEAGLRLLRKEMVLALQMSSLSSEKDRHSLTATSVRSKKLRMSYLNRKSRWYRRPGKTGCTCRISWEGHQGTQNDPAVRSVINGWNTVEQTSSVRHCPCTLECSLFFRASPQEAPWHRLLFRLFRLSRARDVLAFMAGGMCRRR